MRAFATTISALIAMAAQTQAMDWDTFCVNGNPVPHQATVSFFIGYPKGWLAFQDHSQGWHDIYSGIVIAPCNPGPICSFGQPATTNTLKEQEHVLYTVWPSGGATAKEAAETFFNDKRGAAGYAHKSIKPVKTRAGDSGWLVESDGYLIKDPAIAKLTLDPAFMRKTNALDEIIQLEKNVKPDQKIPVIYHDFFFHSGKLGAIHIQIMTETANSSWRSQLDRLVLDTLRFNGFNRFGWLSPLQRPGAP